MFSIRPVSALVVLLNFTPLIQLNKEELVVFLVSAVFLILGIGLFSLGADLAMTPMGEHIGSGLTKSRRMWLLLTVTFAMGLLITIAEPDLSVLASQVSNVLNDTLLIVCVGVGVGLFLLLAILKIVFRKPLSHLLLFFYFLLFALTSLVIIRGNTGFLSLAFDSGGVTTGPITVPFIMALGVGIASTLGGKNVSENSFGLIALCSVGPIIAVMFLGMAITGEISPPHTDYALASPISRQIFRTALTVIKEVTIALALIVVFFLILQFLFLKLPRKKLLQIGVGILYTFVGLVIFLTAVSVGFMPIGYKMGTQLGEHPLFLIIFGFVLGTVTVLAEPAVHVLNKQVEEVTDRMVSKTSMMTALSCGVGISIGLSMLRIHFGFSILYYLIPGYLISLGLSFFVPGLYTAIAFDSGGVASGPLTSSFILPFAIGACMTCQGQSALLTDAFGIVAMVAMTPLITIQLLGFRAITARNVRNRVAMKRILSADDKQIIDFS